MAELCCSLGMLGLFVVPEEEEERTFSERRAESEGAPPLCVGMPDISTQSLLPDSERREPHRVQTEGMGKTDTLIRKTKME